jgi:hypothetical protein
MLQVRCAELLPESHAAMNPYTTSSTSWQPRVIVIVSIGIKITTIIIKIT